MKAILQDTENVIAVILGVVELCMIFIYFSVLIFIFDIENVLLL